MGARFKAARNSVVKRLKTALGLSSDNQLSAKKESVKQPTPPPRTDIPVRPDIPQSPKPTSRTQKSPSTPTPPPIPVGVEPAPLWLSDADYEQNYKPKPPPVPERTYPITQQSSPVPPAVPTDVAPAPLAVSDQFYKENFRPEKAHYQELPLAPRTGQYQDLPLGHNLDLLIQQIGALNNEHLGDISMNLPENAIGDLISQVIWATRALSDLNQQELNTFVEHFPKVLEKCGIALLTPEDIAQKQQTALEKDRERCIESLEALAAEWQFQELNSLTEQAAVVERTQQQLMSRSATLFRNDEAVKPLIEALNRNMQNHLQIQPTPSVDQSNLPPFGGLARQDAPAGESSLQYTKLPPERKRKPSHGSQSSNVVMGGYTDEQRVALQKKGIMPKYAASQPNKQHSPFFNEHMAKAYLEELEMHASNPPDWIFQGIEKFLKGTKDIEGNQVLEQLRQQLEQRTQAQKQSSMQPTTPEVEDNRSHIRAKIGAHREEAKSTMKKKK